MGTQVVAGITQWLEPSPSQAGIRCGLDCRTRASEVRFEARDARERRPRRGREIPVRPQLCGVESVLPFASDECFTFLESLEHAAKRAAVFAVNRH